MRHTETKYGLGLPLTLRPKESLEVFLKVCLTIIVWPFLLRLLQVNFAGRAFYQLDIAGFKAALCISYLRLLTGGDRKGYTLLVWAVMIISTLGHIAGTLVLILRCQPVCQPPLIRYLKIVLPTFSAQVLKSWEPTVDGSCLPVGPPSYASAGFSIACDLAIILLPIPLLLELRMGALKKAGLCGLFLLGFFTTLSSILRLLQIRTVTDGDGDTTMLVLWSTIEFNVGVRSLFSLKVYKPPF